MSYLKLKGIVIKEVNTGEADKSLTIFSKEQGKIYCYAKGARRPKSRFIASSQLLCYSDFYLYKGKEVYNISSCEVIEPFYEIRNDLVRLTYSAHIIDLISDSIQEGQPSGKLIQLLLNTMHMLAKTTKSPELITRIFEMRMLCILGYAPHVNSCVSCNGFTEGASFSFRSCGLVCSGCAANDISAMQISEAAAAALKHIVYAPMNELFSFELSTQAIEDLRRLNRRYLSERLEKEFRKLDFLNELNR